MKENNEIDKIFGERLRSYESDVPAGMWDAIKEGKKKKRGGGWWTFGRGAASVGVLVIAAIGWGLSDYSTSKDTIDLTAVNQLTSTSKNDNASTSSDDLSAQNSVKNVIASSNQLSEITKTDITTYKKQSAQKESAQKEIITTSIAKSPKNTSITTAINNIRVVEKTNLLSNKATSSNADENATTNFSTIDFLSYKPLEKLDIGKNGPSPCYAFNPYNPSGFGKPVYYLELMASPNFANRTLTASASDWEDYALVRDSVESSQVGFSSTLRVSAVFANRVAFRTGITYTRFNEKLDLFDGTATETIINNIEDANGNIIGTDTVTITGQLTKTTFNRFHLVDIPFIFGHEIRDKNFSISVNGGAFVNVLFRQRGEIFNENQEVVSINSGSDESDLFKDRVGVSFYGSMGIHYYLDHRFSITAEPHIHYFPNSFTRSAYPVKQNYWSAGINVGLRYRL